MPNPTVTVNAVKWNELCQRGGFSSDYRQLATGAPEPIMFDRVSDVLHFVSEMTDVLGVIVSQDVVDTMELTYDTEPDSVTVMFRGLVLV